MPTPRETILQALLAALQSVHAATVLRGAILPVRIPAGGLLILRDADPGTPEVTLSPLQYHYEHRAEIEVIVQDKTPAARDVSFDTLLAGLACADHPCRSGPPPAAHHPQPDLSDQRRQHQCRCLHLEQRAGNPQRP